MDPATLAPPRPSPRSPPSRNAHHNNHHDGFMNFMHRDEEVNYFPSRWAQNEGGGGTFPPAPTLASTLAPGMCRFDPVRHADRPPQPAAVLSGRREKQVSDLGWAAVWPRCSLLFFSSNPTYSHAADG